MQVEYWIVHNNRGVWERWVKYPSLEAASAELSKLKLAPVYAVAMITTEIVFGPLRSP